MNRRQLLALLGVGGTGAITYHVTDGFSSQPLDRDEGTDDDPDEISRLSDGWEAEMQEAIDELDVEYGRPQFATTRTSHAFDDEDVVSELVIEPRVDGTADWIEAVPAAGVDAEDVVNVLRGAWGIDGDRTTMVTTDDGTVTLSGDESTASDFVAYVGTTDETGTVVAVRGANEETVADAVSR